MPSYVGKGAPTRTRRASNGKVLERIKSLSYSATVNKLLLDIEADTTEGSVKAADIGELEIVNTGKHPVFAILAYRLWTAAASMSGTTYHVNYLLKSGEGMIVPNSPAVIADETIEQLAGTAVTNAVPSVTANYAYEDSGTTIDDAGVEAADTTFTVDDGDFFRVNDLIQFGINTTTATKIEICRVTAIATNVLTLERALYALLQMIKMHKQMQHQVLWIMQRFIFHFLTSITTTIDTQLFKQMEMDNSTL